MEADESFRTHAYPVTFDDLRMGCRYDARLEIPGWCEKGFDDSGWNPALREKTPKGKAKLCKADPIVCSEKLTPVEVKHYDRLPFCYENTSLDAAPMESTYRDNVYVYDFGVNTAGITVLRINGKKGQKITIRHGEHLVGGKFSVNTTIFNRSESLAEYLDYGQTDVYICKGGALALAAEFKTAIREHLIDFRNVTAAGDCQTSQALAIETGLFEADELEAAGRRLVEIIHRDGDVNACGMIGLRYVYHALTRIGETDLAVRVITARHPHCYGYWVEHGATSMLESFQEVDSPNVNSNNHHFLADVSSWMIQELCGIKPNPQADDMSVFEISPHFAESLSFAEGYYDSRFGRLWARWERRDGGVRLEVDIPAGMKGRLVAESGWQLENGGTELDLPVGRQTILLSRSRG